MTARGLPWEALIDKVGMEPPTFYFPPRSHRDRPHGACSRNAPFPVVPLGPVPPDLGLDHRAWCLVAWVVIASMLKEQRESTTQTVDEKVDGVSKEIQQLRDDHTGRMTALQGEIDELERVMRTAFEEIDHPLPPRRVLLRANFVGGSASVSAAVLVVGGSRMARLRRWARSKAQWVKGWVKRIVWDWNKAA